MPCDTVITNTVQFLAKSTDVRLLKLALESLGYTVTETMTGLSFHSYNSRGSYNRTTGELVAQGRSELDVSAVKRAYSKAVVNSQAKANGWQVSWSTNEQGNDVAEVQKAAY